MPKKLVFEMSIYTDGDWHYDDSIFVGYTSKYFDNELFEYTLNPDDYTLKVRRTFEDVDKGFNRIVDILTKFKASIGSSRDVDTIREFFAKQIASAENRIPFWDDMDSNTEITLEVKIVENNSKPIKRIIYDD